MAKDNTNGSELAQVIAAAASQGSSNSPALNELIEKLNRKLGRELDDEEEKRSQQIAARKANAEFMVEAHRLEVARQSSCTHTKPGTNRTALGGQKTHRGWYTLICQYCGKQFSSPAQRPEEAVPAHLAPDMSTIGGPNH